MVEPNAAKAPPAPRQLDLPEELRRPLECPTCPSSSPKPDPSSPSFRAASTQARADFLYVYQVCLEELGWKRIFRSVQSFELVERWITALLEDGMRFEELTSAEGVEMTEMGLGNLIEALYKSDALDMLKLKEDACAFAISVVCQHFAGNQDGSYCLHNPSFPGIKTFPPRSRPTLPSPPLISRLLAFLSTGTSTHDEVLRTYSTLTPLVLPTWKLYNDLATKCVTDLLASPAFSLEFTLFFSRIVDPLKLLAVAHRDLRNEFGEEGMGTKTLRPEMKETGTARIAEWCTAGKASEWVEKLELLEKAEKLGKTLEELKKETETLAEKQAELVEKETGVRRREEEEMRRVEEQRVEREQKERTKLERELVGVRHRQKRIEEEQERLRKESERLVLQGAELEQLLALPLSPSPPSTIVPIPALSSIRDNDEAPPTESLSTSSPSPPSSRSSSPLLRQTETTSRPSTAETVDELDRPVSGDEQHVLLLCKSVLLGLLERQEEQAASLRDRGHPVDLTPIPAAFRSPHRGSTSGLAAARGLPPLQFGTPSSSTSVSTVVDSPSSVPSPSRPLSHASTTGEFVQGSSKDHLPLPTKPHPFLTLAPKIPSTKSKGKGPEEPCTCNSRSSSPRRKSRPRPASQRPSTLSDPSSLPLTSPDPADFPPITPRRKLPWICPLETHHPGHAHSDASCRGSPLPPPPLPTPIRTTPDEELDEDLERCFENAYSTALEEINNSQLMGLLQASAPALLGKVWACGGSPKAFVGGRIDEAKAIFMVTGEIVGYVSKAPFQERVARLATRVAFAKVLDVVTAEAHLLLQSHTRPPKDYAVPPCLCHLSANRRIVTAALKRLDVRPPSPLQFIEPSDALKDLCTTLITKGKLTGPEWTTPGWGDSVELAYKRFFQVFRTAIKTIRPATYLPARQILAVFASQGGAAAWDLARRQRRAIEAQEKEYSWPLRCWEQAAADSGRGRFERFFSAENARRNAQHVSLTARDAATKKQYEYAVTQFSLAAILVPDDPRTYVRRAMARIELNRPWQLQEAVLDCTMVLALDPESGDARFWRGMAYSKLQQWALAIADFEHEACRLIEPELSKELSAAAAKELELTATVAVAPDPLEKQPTSTQTGFVFPASSLPPWTCPPGRCSGSPRYDQNAPLLSKCLQLLFANLFEKYACKEITDQTVVIIRRFIVSAVLRELADGRLERILRKPVPFVRKVSGAFLKLDPVRQELTNPATMEASVVVALQQASTTMLLDCEKATDAMRPCLCSLSSQVALGRLVTSVENIHAHPASLPPELDRESASSEICQDVKKAIKSGTLVGRYWAGDAWKTRINRLVDLTCVGICGAAVETKLDPVDVRPSLYSLLATIGGLRVFSTLLRTGSTESEDLRGWAKVGAERIPVERAVVFEDMGDQLCREENFEEAIPMYSVALTLSLSARLLLKRVRAYRHVLPTPGTAGLKDRLLVVVRDCTLALRMEPTNAELLLLRGAALFAQDRLVEAYGDLQASFTLDPSNDEVNFVASRVISVLLRTRRQPSRVQTEHPVYCPHPLNSALLSVFPLRFLPSTVSSNDLADPPDSIVDTFREALLTPAPPRPETPANGMADAALTISLEIPSSQDDLPRSTFHDPRLACPPGRCHRVAPNPANLSKLDHLLLQAFLGAHKKELSCARPESLVATRQLLLHHYIRCAGWEKKNPERDEERAVMRNGIQLKVKAIFAEGPIRAGYGLEDWVNGSMVVMRSLDALLPPMPCICVLSSKLQVVEGVLNSLATSAKDLPPHAHLLPPLDIDAFIKSCQLKVNSGGLVGSMWRSPAQWHAKVRKVAEVFEQVFQSLMATFDLKSIEDDYPKVATFVGGISTFEVAHRLILHVGSPADRFSAATVLTPGTRSQDVCGWSAFIAANAPRSFSKPLDEVDEMEKVELAVKSLRSGLKLAQEGQHRLAIRDYSAAAIWASSSLNRDNMLISIYLGLSHSRNELKTDAQWLESIADSTLALSYAPDDAQLLYCRAEGLVTLGHYSQSLDDVERALKLGANSPYAPAWREQLADLRIYAADQDARLAGLKPAPLPRRFPPVAAAPLKPLMKPIQVNGDSPTERSAPTPSPPASPPPAIAAPPALDAQAPKEATSLADLDPATAVAQVPHVGNGAPPTATTTNGSASSNGAPATSEVPTTIPSPPPPPSQVATVRPPTLERSASSCHGSSHSSCCHLDLRIVCPPDRHYASPSETQAFQDIDEDVLDHLDDLLIRIFALGNRRSAILAKPGKMMDTRWIILQRYLSADTVWEKANLDAVEVKKVMAQTIRTQMQRMFTCSVIAGYGMDSFVAGIAESKRLINCLFPTPSCICRLATPSALESLDALLATLRTMPLPTRLKTPPTDLASLLAFCKAGVADWSLSGGVWRSAKAWKAKVPVLARVFDEVFESVVREGKTEAYDQAWLDVARAVGGVETYAMSQRAELEGGEECESWKSWMCFIGTGSGMEEGEGAEEERRVTAERRRELGLVEVGKGEYASALREFGVAVLLNPEDGRLYDDLCLARASIAGDHQLHEIIADASLGMVVSPPSSQDARLLYIRAGALVALGNAAAAGEDYALLAALNPDALRQESQRLRTKLTGMIELAEETAANAELGAELRRLNEVLSVARATLEETVLEEEELPDVEYTHAEGERSLLEKIE